MFAHKCPHCGKMTTYFDEEMPYREFGLEGKGTVKIYHCEHCGAVITVMVPENEEKTEESENGY